MALPETLILTSSPTGPLDGSRQVHGLDPMNGFPEALAERWPCGGRVLMVSAFPEDAAANDEMGRFFEGVLREAGLPVSRFLLWDARLAPLSGEEVAGFDAILLGGGHVPTQNAFFRRIGLKEKLSGFSGLVLGISAGSMNCARLVYAQPELPGEAEDPEYRRFLPGLGLTETMILPHLQMVRHHLLDGRRLFEDITFVDSFGRRFLAIPDGSYCIREAEEERVYGEAFVIEDGVMRQICGEGESAQWHSGRAS